MVREKTQVKRIENAISRQVTFCKRRNGLLKKAYELSELCDAEVGLVIFSPRGRLHEFATPSMQKMQQKYDAHLQACDKNTTIQKDDIQCLKRELADNAARIMTLEATKRKMLGEGLASCSFTELNQLEDKAQRGLRLIRARKTRILAEKIEQLKGEEKEKTRNCRSKGRDKVEITAVPLKVNQMQTRLNRLKQVGPEKKEKTPARRKRKERMKN